MNLKNIFNFNLMNKIITFVFGTIIAFFLFFSLFILVSPIYALGPYEENSIHCTVLSIISIALIFYLVNIKNKIIKYLFIFLSSLFILLEISSLYFLGEDINTTFLVNILDIEFIKAGISLRPLLSLSALLCFPIIFLFLFFSSKIVPIKNRVIRYSTLLLPIFYLLSPFGFVYKVGYKSDLCFIKDIFIYGKYNYNELFKIITGNDYTTRDNLIATSNNKKNLVIIYLESFEQEYLYNDYLIKYSTFLKELSQKHEFHYNLEQMEHADYTTAAMFTTMCGLPLNSYVFDKLLLKNEADKIVCLPNILKKAGYKQVYIGGANGNMFHKKSLFNIFEFNEFYDKKTISDIYNNKLDKSNWGIYDYDMFNFAKEKYKELSKSQQPFNLTLLTLATHNENGIYDKRCKNSDSINLANGIECTDYLLKDFIEFLEKQPNFKDTLIIILPDHLQYNNNTLKDKIKDKNKRKLFTILINSNKQGKYENKILYTDLIHIIKDNLDITTNAQFIYSNIENGVSVKLNMINKNENLMRMFLYKITRK